MSSVGAAPVAMGERPIIMLNPGHGNEPYILTAAIGQSVANRMVAAGLEQPALVMPLLYGERQLNILAEEHPNATDNLFVDETLGQIVEPIVFGSGDFTTHLKQVGRHFDEVQQALDARYDRQTDTSFEARNVGSREATSFSPHNIVASIEAGNRTTFPAAKKFFAFPEVLSRILDETLQAGGLGFDQSDIQALKRRVEHVEATYTDIYIPRVSTFSYQFAGDLGAQPTVVDGRHRTYTPPMKAAPRLTEGAVGSGIYAMFSGTRSGTEATHALVEAVHAAGMNVYSPPWEEKVEGTVKVSPDVQFDSNVRAIMGRSGWGTLWRAMQARKPMLATAYQLADDPEIYFNNLTIEALGLGKVIEPGNVSPDQIKQAIDEIEPRLARYQTDALIKFGTIDGIAFIGQSIFENMFAA